MKNFVHVDDGQQGYWASGPSRRVQNEEETENFEFKLNVY